MLGKDEIQRGEGKLNTIIGKGSTFMGNLEVAGGLRIDGKIEGNVKAESIFMGKEAEIRGDIFTHTAVLGGKVFGNITSSFVELQSKAELYGDVTTKSLIVAEGVIMQGNCDMGLSDRIRKTEKAEFNTQTESLAPTELVVIDKPTTDASASVEQPSEDMLPSKKDKHKKK